MDKKRWALAFLLFTALHILVAVYQRHRLQALYTDLSGAYVATQRDHARILEDARVALENAALRIQDREAQVQTLGTMLDKARAENVALRARWTACEGHVVPAFERTVGVR